MKNLRAQPVLRAMQAYVEDKAAKSAMKIALGLFVVNLMDRFPPQWGQWIGAAGLTLILKGAFEVFSRQDNN